MEAKKNSKTKEFKNLYFIYFSLLTLSIKSSKENCLLIISDNSPMSSSFLISQPIGAFAVKFDRHE